MRHKREFGQIFLKDQKYIREILKHLEIEKKEVLEIGPGEGQITELIAQKAKQLCCIEVDKRFFSFLTKKFTDRPHVKIINSDILKFPLSNLGRKVIVFGNVPYQISSSLVKYLINQRKYIVKAYLTFQKEFAAKLLANAADDKYCFLSCYIQYYAKVKKVFDIPATSFYPQPKVNSTFIELNFYPCAQFTVQSEDFLFKVIRNAFSGRRKKIGNSLVLGDKSKMILDALRIDPESRAEDLSLEKYVSLANYLYQDRFI